MANCSVKFDNLNNVNCRDEDFITEIVLYYVFLVNFWGVGQCVTILGIGNNILNIITFVKQGVRDTVNISLLMLAISDLGSLIFLFFWNVLSTPALIFLDLPFYPEQIRWQIGWLHVILIRVSTGITALITFERCLCIAAPLKVKTIITPRRTLCSIFITYLIMIGHISPMFYTSRYTWVIDWTRNKSVLGLTYIENRNDMEQVVFAINAVLPTIFFIFIAICTAILVKILREKSRWRQQTVTSSKGNDISGKDAKAVKMVVLIAVVYIVCFLPGIVLCVWGIFDAELRPDGKHSRTMYVFTSIMIHMEAVNATTNFFIYIRMSSKFRTTLRQIFKLETKHKV